MDAYLAELRRTQIKDYWYAAAAALAWADYLFTIDQEIRFVWRRRVNASKVFFMLARYFALLTTIVSFNALWKNEESGGFTTRCRSGHYLRNLSAGFTIIFSEAILILRTYAIYNCNKKLLLFLIAVFLGVIGAEGYILVKDVRRPVDNELSQELQMKDCAESHASTTIFVLEYVLILSFETLIAALTFHQWIKRFRKSASPFIKGLYRDGLVYYIFLCLLSLINIAMMQSKSLKTQNQYNNILAVFQPVLHAAFAARIWFGLSAPSSLSLLETANIDTIATLSTLHFSSRGAEEVVDNCDNNGV